MPLFVRICLQDLKSKTFNVSDNNFHLKSSFSGISGAFIIYRQRRIVHPPQYNLRFIFTLILISVKNKMYFFGGNY